MFHLLVYLGGKFLSASVHWLMQLQFANKMSFENKGFYFVLEFSTVGKSFDLFHPGYDLVRALSG
jgi:hypothetical protein